jgi:hypothetical protein
MCTKNFTSEMGEDAKKNARKSVNGSHKEKIPALTIKHQKTRMTKDGT